MSTHYNRWSVTFAGRATTNKWRTTRRTRRRCSSVDSLFFFGHGSSCIRVRGRQRRDRARLLCSAQVARDMRSTDASNQPTPTICPSVKVSTRLNRRGPAAISVLLAPQLRLFHRHPAAATDNGVVDVGADFVEFRRSAHSRQLLAPVDRRANRQPQPWRKWRTKAAPLTGGTHPTRLSTAAGGLADPSTFCFAAR